MELRVLESFLALAREGSVSAAAEALHLSQPALSRQLMGLERELGTTLFERGGRGIELTADGMLLRRRAVEIVELASITVDEVTSSRGEMAGSVRVGCAETRAVDLVADVMAGMRRDHPRVSFQISSGLAEDMVERIGRGLLDFGLLLRLRGHWGLEALRLPTGERAVVVLRADEPLASRPVVTFDELAEVPVMIPSSWERGGILGGELPASRGGRLQVAAEFDLPFNATRLVRAGLGAAVMLDGLAEGVPAEGLAVRPLDVALDMPSYLVWKPHGLRSRACAEFLDRMRAAYGTGDGSAAPVPAPHPGS